MKLNYYDIIPSKKCILIKILESKSKLKPSHDFILTDKKNYTYRDINESANKLAHGLLQKGISKGDKVAVLMDSSPQYLDVWFAISKIGAVEVPINTAYKGDILKHILDSSDTRVILFDKKYVNEVNEINKECKKIDIYIINDKENDCKSYPNKLDNFYLHNTNNLNVNIKYSLYALIRFYINNKY